MHDSIVYVFRDVTATARYNALIAGERAKSDTLLKSILPPSLVPRVQAGEKNISFAINSATIVFMDIVSFTPWCGSSTAERAMMTLNRLFKKLDINCGEQPTMTKIKCIGDCYVAAGGVFSEVNQPMEHARQVVQFGLDSLESLRELNQELNESLQMRVGINTGGPIIAGVLGGGAAKPTFEILGPSINMAQQMEHHGVPMQVHVSRSVYELIYGDNFVVKERGTIVVKGASVVTYLVSHGHRPRDCAGPRHCAGLRASAC
jgi:class 3 adenylate cyclase